MERVQRAPIREAAPAAHRHAAQLAPSPVYNVTFEPGGDDLTTLVDKRPTTVHFFIGPQNARNALKADNWLVNPEVLHLPDDTALFVTMNCLVCSGDSFQKKAITYRRSEELSSDAAFEILPDRSKMNPKRPQGQIVFDVSGEGRLYDHIVLNVNVAVTSEGVLPLQRSSAIAAPKVFDRPSPEERGVDLTITVKQIPGGPIGLMLAPLNESLRQAFRQRHLSNGQLKVFETRLLTLNELNRLIGDSYLNVRSVTDGLRPLQKLTLPPASQQEVVDALFSIGARIYDRLFNNPADRDLLAIIREVEKRSDRQHPLRVQIDTQDVYLPWQLIHPPGNPEDVTSFWGFKFELAVIPTYLSPVRLGGRLYSVIGVKPEATAFLQYRRVGDVDPDHPDSVSSLGDSMATSLTSRLGQAGFLRLTRKDEFLRTVQAQAASLELVLAYVHASSGTVFRKDPQVGMVVETEAEGPRLILYNESVKPSEVESIRLKVPIPESSESPFLSRQPIILLDACESGSSGVSPTTSFDFPGVWLDMGARGVVATEAPVEAFQAFHFANHLIEEVLSGENIPTALFKTRLWLLDSGSPIGLLYSYYGSPSAGVIRSEAIRGIQ